MRSFLTLFVLTMLSFSVAAQEGLSVGQQRLFQLLNQTRSEHGLAPLTWDASLAAAAQVHAERMSHGSGMVQHQYSDEADIPVRIAQQGGHFGSVAENIAATTGNVDAIHNGWLNSPPHLANILSPTMTAVGIGVFTARGTIYVAEDFGRSGPNLSFDEIESRARQELRSQGIKIDASDEAKQEARTACQTPSNSGKATFALQWEGPDLNQLPGVVMQSIPQAHNYTAAVGACPSKRANQPLTTYHVAVLMY